MIESDIEEIESHRRNKDEKVETNLLCSPPSDSFPVTIFKYFLVFSISSIIFTYLFISYTPVIKLNYLKALEFIESGNLLDKMEELLNFLLQDD